jgi:hypothetical protein
MHLSWLDNFLWLAGFVGEAVLLLVMLLRSRWRAFPIFTSLTAFCILRSITLFYVYRLGSTRSYAITYWTLAGVDYAFQIAVLYEIVKNVLKPSGRWGVAISPFLFRLAAAGVLLAAISSLITHPLTKSTFQAWMDRGSLFTSLLVAELFLVIMLMSNRLGLVWGNHVMALGQGLSAWTLIALAVDIVHSVTPFHTLVVLDQIRIIAYMIALIYWILAFWKDEPQTSS